MHMKRIIGFWVMMLVFSLGIVQECTFAKKLPDVVVRQHNGRPTVFIDGKPDALPGYCPSYTKTFYNKFMETLSKDNLSLFFIAYQQLPGDPGSSQFWAGDKIDNKPVVELPDGFFGMDQQAEQTLKRNPNAYIIVRFRHAAPESWRKLHPSEYFIDEEAVVHKTPSYASDYYWEKGSDVCTALVSYVESRPWANRVIGYMNIHLAEGIHLPLCSGFFYDHNPAMIQKWREFLKKKYSTEENLRGAYGDPELRFATMQIPKEKLRSNILEVTDLLYWQNARDNRGLRDYLELQRELFHLRFRQISAGMKKGANRNVLLLHDALKQPMIGWNLYAFFAHKGRSKISWNPAYPELIAGSGSMGVADLFGTTPGFDGLVTPHDYQVRGLGGVYEPEGISDSSVLRGIIFFSEMDTRSCIKCADNNVAGLGAAHNPKQWAAITWRNFATGFTRGFFSYWHHSWTVAEDWFYEKGYHDVIKRQAEVINESINWVHEDVPGIAMILDDTAVMETNGSGNYLNEAIMWEYKMGMARCGVPFRIYLFEDLALDNFPKHRVYYFPNLFRVDDERLAVLKKKVFRDGNVVIWGPGSGISDGEKIGTESASRLTGFQFTMIPANAPRRILISNFDHPITKTLTESMVIGGPLAYGPILIPIDGTKLGRAWTKGGLNHTGMSLKEFGKGAALSPKGISLRGDGDYASIFMTAVQIPADLWRNIARYAGAHVYSEAGDILLADRNVVALHSLRSGPKTIKLPEKSRVRDLVTGKIISRGTTEIKFKLDAPETCVFLLEH